MAIVNHKGRKSGKVHRTPVQAFRTDSGYVIALAYGRGTDWERNVVALGTCLLEARGETMHMTNPRVLTGPAGLQKLPAVLRPAMKLFRVDSVMLLDRDTATVAARGDPTNDASNHDGPIAPQSSVGVAILGWKLTLGGGGT